MNGLLLTVTWLTPLLLLPLAFSHHWRWSLAISALPALVTAVVLETGASIHVAWLLIGTTLHLDETGGLFLLFSALLWLFAGTYAAITMDANRGSRRFSAFYLLACSGNLLLILSGDFVSFYVGFAIMGLAATGLIAHRRSQHARRAAKVYLGWTLIGELAIFTGILVLAFANETMLFADLTIDNLPESAGILLVLGFGVKLALPGLHFWLPLAYPAAPATATAVLSGPMISAGLLGWLRFLPPGGATPFWAEALVVVGVIGSVLGILAGLPQRDPRAVLAYSSIAKMGLITCAFGMALIYPQASAPIVAAVIAFAMHHLMLKGTLFMGIAEWERKGSRNWVMAGLGILAFSLMGVSLSSGAGAKIMIENAVEGIGIDAGLLFFFSALGTALLMARLFWLLRQRKVDQQPGFDQASLVWMTLVLAAILLPLSLMPTGMNLSLTGSILAVLAAVAAFAIKGPRDGRPASSLIPPGDLLLLIRSARQYLTGRSRMHELLLSPRALLLGATEGAVTRTVGALVWLVVILLFVTLAIIPNMDS